MTAIAHWWAGRSLRERWMVAVLGALLAALLLWFGVLTPLARAQAAAEARLDRAIETKAAVDRALGELAALHRRIKPPASSISVDAAVSSSAEAAGLGLDRVEADPGGGVQAIAQGVAPTDLFPWLIALQQDHGVIASHLTVLKGDDGLDVDATFVRAGS